MCLRNCSRHIPHPSFAQEFSGGSIGLEWLRRMSGRGRAPACRPYKGRQSNISFGASLGKRSPKRIEIDRLHGAEVIATIRGADRTDFRRAKIASAFSSSGDILASEGTLEPF